MITNITMHIPSLLIVPPLVATIKITATLLITAALGLEGIRFYLATVNYDLMANLPWLFYLERLALIIHFIEAIIAGIYVKKISTTSQQSALYQGIYTFLWGQWVCWNYGNNIKRVN